MFQAVCLRGKLIHRTDLSINKYEFNHFSFNRNLSRESYRQSRISKISQSKVNYDMQNYWDFHCMLDTRNNHDLHLFRTLKFIYDRIKVKTEEY
mgnify:CR=1 FL=1